MSIQMGKSGDRSVNIDRLLRVQNTIDLIFNNDLLRQEADVRASLVVDINSKAIALAQTSPPVLKSMINKPIEATFVNFDMVTSERTRWGWESQILGINNEYIPEDAPPNTTPAQVIFIALPERGVLRASNVRLDYRLAVNPHDKITVKTSPATRDATLLNFSAGGVMIAVPGAPELQTGAQMHVRLIFPWPDINSPTSIKSKAEVVRVDYARAEETTRLGLHFQEMDTEIDRTFHKIINHYMLAERRNRKAGL